MRLFHGITREAFQEPTHGRLWCGKIFSGRNRSCPQVSNVSSPPILPWKKPSLVLSKVEAKASVWSFCFTLKLRLLEPTLSAVGPGSCQTHMVAWSWERERECKYAEWMQVTSEREKDRLYFIVPLGLY